MAKETQSVWKDVHDRVDTAKGVAGHIIDATTRNAIDATLETVRSLAHAIETSNAEILRAVEGRTPGRK